MIFYLATAADGMRHLETVATKAKAIDKNYATLEIGTSKPELQTALQELLTLADEAHLKAVALNSDNAEPGVMRAVGLDEHTIAKETGDVDHHDGRCPKCHRILTNTVEGAEALALGEDMSIIQDMIDSSPDWFKNGIESAIMEEKHRRSLDAKPEEAEQSDALGA